MPRSSTSIWVRRLVLMGCLVSIMGGYVASAAAQINTEKLRRGSKPGYSGSIAFTGTLQQGNVDLLLVGARARGQYAVIDEARSSSTTPYLRDLVYFVGDLTMGVSGGNTIRNQGFGHLRWTRMWVGPIGTELFAQAQFNELVLLRQRFLGGGGVRFDVHFGPSEIAFGAGYMLEYELQNVSADGPDPERLLAHRSTNYLAIKLASEDPKVSFVNTIYVQPALHVSRRPDLPDDRTDIRVLNEGVLEVALTDTLSFLLSASIVYDNAPVMGTDEDSRVEKLDTTFTNRIQFSF